MPYIFMDMDQTGKWSYTQETSTREQQDKFPTPTESATPQVEELNRVEVQENTDHIDEQEDVEKVEDVNVTDTIGADLTIISQSSPEQDDDEDDCVVVSASEKINPSKEEEEEQNEPLHKKPRTTKQNTKEMERQTGIHDRILNILTEFKNMDQNPPAPEDCVRTQAYSQQQKKPRGGKSMREAGKKAQNRSSYTMMWSNMDPTAAIQLNYGDKMMALAPPPQYPQYSCCGPEIPKTTSTSNNNGVAQVAMENNAPPMGTVECRLCKSTITSRSSYQLVLHFGQHFAQTRRYGCPMCPFRSTVAAGVTNHMARRHGTRATILDNRSEHLYATWRRSAQRCFPDSVSAIEQYIQQIEATLNRGDTAPPSSPTSAGSQVKPLPPPLPEDRNAELKELIFDAFNDDLFGDDSVFGDNALDVYSPNSSEISTTTVSPTPEQQHMTMTTPSGRRVNQEIPVTVNGGTPTQHYAQAITRPHNTNKMIPPQPCPVPESTCQINPWFLGPYPYGSTIATQPCGMDPVLSNLNTTFWNTTQPRPSCSLDPTPRLLVPPTKPDGDGCERPHSAESGPAQFNYSYYQQTPGCAQHLPTPPMYPHSPYMMPAGFPQPYLNYGRPAYGGQPYFSPYAPVMYWNVQPCFSCRSMDCIAQHHPQPTVNGNAAKANEHEDDSNEERDVMVRKRAQRGRVYPDVRIVEKR